MIKPVVVLQGILEMVSRPPLHPPSALKLLNADSTEFRPAPASVEEDKEVRSQFYYRRTC